MEILKQRLVPVTLKYMRSLNARLKLTDKERLYYSNLEKGYAGELIFDQLLLTNLSLNCLILNDVLLESNNNEFQNDTFLISQNTLYQFEVKNFEGDFYLERNKWYSFPKNNIKNPMLQLEKSETLIHQLVREHGFNFEIKPLLIFVNPGFHLYHAPSTLPIIYPTQLYRFIKKMNNIPANLTGRHYDFADKLLSLHLKESKNMKIPPYSFEQVGKGFLCGMCSSITTYLNGGFIICKKCGCMEEVDAAVLRAVDEFKFLFPNLLITTNIVHVWCGGVVSRKTIRRVLMKNFKLLGYAKSSHYVDF